MDFTMFDCLPNEVFFDILLRLSFKAIIKSRCVSKTWCSLIASPQFIATHLNRSLSNPKNPYLFLRHFDEQLIKARLTLHSSDVPFPSNIFTELRSTHQYIDKLCIVAGSSNGLLCLARYLWGPVHDPYVLWNPSIQKTIALPNPDVGIRSSKHYITSVGFGYVPNSDDYKLVRLVFHYCNPQHIAYGITQWVQIYTVRTRAWRTFGVQGPPYHIKMSTSAAFLHGAVYWPAYIEQHRDERHYVIVSFDLADEAFREVGMPESLQKKAYASDVAVLDGLIALVHNPNTWLESRTVWVMKEYGVVESWTKLFDIKMLGNKTFLSSRLIGFKKTGKVLLEIEGDLFSYEPSKQRTKFLPFHGLAGSHFLDRYVESLVLLNVPNTSMLKPT